MDAAGRDAVGGPSEEARDMASTLFEVLKLLEEKRISFFIQRDRSDGLTITAVPVGKRVEISVTEDDTVDVAVFRGDEQVEVGMDAVRKALEESEIVFTALGKEPISAATALAIVKMVIADYYGAQELAAEEPLKVEDGGGIWNINGSRIQQPYDRGPIMASVSKLDAAILSLTL
jgi:hypothetical protein